MIKPVVPGLCSVVCVTYNHAAFCLAGLKSIYDQIYRNIEIIVLDDGSPDGTADVLRRNLVDCPFPNRLIAQENTGNVGLNYNRALDVASGEYICFLSLDDMLLPDCISSKMPTLLTDKQMMFVGNTTNIEIGKNGEIVTPLFKQAVHGQECTTASQLLEIEYDNVGTFYVQGVVFRRLILSLVGGFDVAMTGDDLILRTRIFQYMDRNPEMRFALLSRSGFAYRKHDQNLHRNVFRQLRTVLEWRAAYFPSRPLPKPFTRWANFFFRVSIAKDEIAELNKALDYSPELAALFKIYTSSWTYRRKRAKRFVKHLLGIKPRSASASKPG